MEFWQWKNIFVALAVAAVFTATIFFVRVFVAKSHAAAVLNPEVQSAVSPPLPKKLENPPQIIKAVYITANSAARKTYLDYLSRLFKTTQINAVVVDIKDSSGRVSYGAGNLIPDIDSLVRFFHDKNVYVIGRIVVFQDTVFSKARPELAILNRQNKQLWKDNNNLSWVDPSSKEVWDYNVSLAKDAFLRGFDEINFDYVRFPSDGRVDNMSFPVYNGKTQKREVIKSFFKYLREQLAGEKISADLFGQTTVSKDDMGIGQIIEDAFEYFDYVCPMVYPSHYINGFIGFKNPAEHPYQVIKYSLDGAVVRRAALAEASPAKVRPWLQDFNRGAFYTPQMVQAEIKATQDSLGENYNGFMLWNPSNIYIF